MTDTNLQRNNSFLSCFETALLLLLVIFMPTQAAHAILKGHSYTYIAYGDVITALVFGVWLLTVLLTKSSSGEPRWRTIKLPPGVVWIFIFAAVVSLLNSPSIFRGLTESSGGLKALLRDDRIRNALVKLVQYTLYFLVGYTLLRNLSQDRRRLRSALSLLFVLSTAVLLLGLKQYVHQSNPIQVRATFGTANIYGGFWAMVLPMILSVGMISDSRLVKWWSYLVTMVATLTTLSGGALLALLIVLPVTAYKFQRQAGLKMAGALLAGLIVISVLGTRTYRQNLREFVKIQDAEGDIKKQYIEWQADVNMLADHFLTGVGLGDYQLNIGEYYTYLPNKLKMPFDCNNEWLVMASSMGITGLVAFMLLLGYHEAKARKGFSQAKDGYERAVLLGCWGGLFGFGITSIFHALLVRGTGVLLIFFLAIIGTLTSSERQ